MTPAARLAAAIDLLDLALSGEPVERCLTRWSRASRYAGSKDRAAVRDLVYEALRCRNSFAHAGGAMTGRGLMIGGHLLSGQDLDVLFCEDRFAPAPLTQSERDNLKTEPSSNPSERLDYDPALEAELGRSLGDGFEPVLLAMRERAPVDLRVNFLKTDRQNAQRQLADEGILSDVLEDCSMALRVREGARQIKGSAAFRDGLIELQDLSSQSVAEFADPQRGELVLDYCTGGGGKTLAMGSLSKGLIDLHAFDVNPRRMQDLPARAERAGLSLNICNRDQLVPLQDRCDLVMVDGPCSGSGAWRRNPQQKWLLSPEKLNEYNAMQDDALDKAALYVRPGGRMIYATCSLFKSENQDRVDHFLAQHRDWIASDATQLSPLNGSDGFYFIRIVRPQS